jgi:hypothetical protein
VTANGVPVLGRTVVTAAAISVRSIAGVTAAATANSLIALARTTVTATADSVKAPAI